MPILAFDTPEELDAARAEAEANGDVFSYNYLRRNRMRNSIALSQEEVQKLLERKTPYVVRFKMPLDSNYQSWKTLLEVNFR